MLGVLTSDYNEALDLLDEVKSKKILKHSEKISYIYGYHQIVYLYSNEDERDIHELQMQENGWKKVDSQNCVSLYLDLYNGQSVKTPCGIYEKSIFNWKYRK